MTDPKIYFTSDLSLKSYFKFYGRLASWGELDPTSCIATIFMKGTGNQKLLSTIRFCALQKQNVMSMTIGCNSLSAVANIFDILIED